MGDTSYFEKSTLKIKSFWDDTSIGACNKKIIIFLYTFKLIIIYYVTVLISVQFVSEYIKSITIILILYNMYYIQIFVYDFRLTVSIFLI